MYTSALYMYCERISLFQCGQHFLHIFPLTSWTMLIYILYSYNPGSGSCFQRGACTYCLYHTCMHPHWHTYTHSYTQTHTTVLYVYSTIPCWLPFLLVLSCMVLTALGTLVSGSDAAVQPCISGIATPQVAIASYTSTHTPSLLSHHQCVNVLPFYTRVVTS